MKKKPTFKLLQSKLQVTLMASLLATFAMTGCTNDSKKEDAKASETSSEHEDVKSSTVDENAEPVEKLLTNYADMAQAAYEDSLEGAKKLQTAIDTFVADPTEENLQAAKAVYKEARNPYSQTEVFRFDEGFVTANEARKINSVDGWEGQLNAWPLDEALIDYVSEGYAGEYNSENNIINSDKITVGSIEQDTSTITPELLAEMNEIGGSEANVTTGYHAIEFLLWGQDIHGVGEGAGVRPVSDYFTDENCTSGEGNKSDPAICTKRGNFLKAASQLLVNDLTDMVAEWQPDSKDTLRSDLMARKDDNAVRQVFYQMGSLALGELASERMQVAFVTGSTEDEHECFSDLTHLSYAKNAQGIQNLFSGQYKTQTGSEVGGYGLKQYLIDEGNTDAAKELEDAFKQVSTSFDTIVDQGENQGIKVDQMIATVGQASKYGISSEEQNKRRGYVEAAINNLQALTDKIESSAKTVGIDNLDADKGTQF